MMSHRTLSSLLAVMLLVGLAWIAGCGASTSNTSTTVVSTGSGGTATTANGGGASATPTPFVAVAYTDKQLGQAFTIAAIPGQVAVITSSASIPTATIEALALQSKGTPLVEQASQFYYLFSVPVGTEASFVQAMDASPDVVDAFPNPAFQIANSLPFGYAIISGRANVQCVQTAPGKFNSSPHKSSKSQHAFWTTAGVAGVPSVGNGLNLITVDNFQEALGNCPGVTHGRATQDIASQGLGAHGQTLDIGGGAFNSINQAVNQAVTSGNAAGGNTVINVSLQAALVINGQNNPNYQSSQEAFVQSLASNLAQQQAAGNLENVSVVLAAGNGGADLTKILNTLQQQFPNLFNGGHLVIVKGSGAPGACLSGGDSQFSNTTSQKFPFVTSAPDQNVPLPPSASFGIDCSAPQEGTSFAAPAVTNQLLNALQAGGGTPLKQIVPAFLKANPIVDPKCSPSPSPSPSPNPTPARPNFLVSDHVSGAIYKVTNGSVSTVGPGLGAGAIPSFVATDASSNLIVAEFGNNSLVLVNASGSATVLNNLFVAPFGVAIASNGDYIVTDATNSNPVGNIFRVPKGGGTAVKIAKLPNPVAPVGIALDNQGNAIVCETNTTFNDDRLTRVSLSTGSITTVFNYISLGEPQPRECRSVALDPNGNYIVNEIGLDPSQTQQQTTISLITPAGNRTVIKTFLGILAGQVVCDAGSGNYFFIDQTDATLVQLTPGGVPTTKATFPPGSNPEGLAQSI